MNALINFDSLINQRIKIIKTINLLNNSLFKEKAISAIRSAVILIILIFLTNKSNKVCSKTQYVGFLFNFSNKVCSKTQYFDLSRATPLQKDPPQSENTPCQGHPALEYTPPPSKSKQNQGKPSLYSSRRSPEGAPRIENN